MGTLTKANPNFLPELPSLFDDFFTRDFFQNMNNRGNQSLPAVNVLETEDSFDLEVAAPGMRKDDFKVELENNTLSISAEREEKDEEKNKRGNFTRREFHYQNFMRSFNLPENMVESDKITARYTDGVLKISIPKAEQAKTKPPKMIEIS